MSKPFLTLNVKLEDSFRKKINHELYKRAEQETIRKVTLEAEKQCKKYAPGPGNQLPGTKYKASGHLRASHSSVIGPNEGMVVNNSGYAQYVILGTSKMPARNYPRQVNGRLAGTKYMTRTFLTELRKMGVLD